MTMKSSVVWVKIDCTFSWYWAELSVFFSSRSAEMRGAMM